MGEKEEWAEEEMPYYTSIRIWFVLPCVLRQERNYVFIVETS